MKKVLKITIVLFVLVAGLFILSSTALHFLLPPEKAKALILKQLTGRLKREVSVGKVSVGLISGLSVTELKVSESPNFSKGTFLSSDRFFVRLALWPLLARRVEVKQLTLDRPMINIVRLADGKTFNFADLMESTTAPAPVQARSWNPLSLPEAHAAPATPPPAEESPFVLLISHADIQNGVVRFLDRSPAQQSVDVESLDLKLRNVSKEKPFSVQTSFRAKARKIAADFKLSGEADLAAGSIKVKNCDISSAGSNIHLSGMAGQLKTNRPVVDFELQLKEFKLATLAAFAPLPPGLTMEGPVTGGAKIKGDFKKMDFSAGLDLENVRAAYEKKFSKPAKVPMNVQIRGSVSEFKDLTLTELKAALASLQLKAHGKILGLTGPQPQLNLHLETNSFPVMEVAPLAGVTLPQGMALKGSAQLSADISGTQASSRLAAKCEARELDMAWADKFAKPAGVPLRLAVLGELIQGRPAPAKRGVKKATVAQVMNFQTLSFVLGAIELNGNGSVRAEAQQPRFQLALKSNNFSIGELAQRVPLMAAYQPGGNAVVEVRASGTSAAPQVNGTVALQNVSARYQQSDVTQVAGLVSFTRQDVSIPKLTGKLNGADLTMKLVGRRLDTHPDINVEASVTEVVVERLMATVRPSAPATQHGQAPRWIAEAWAAPVGVAKSPPSPPMDLSGVLTIGRVKHEFYNAQKLDFKWDLKNVTPDLSQMSGTAILKQGPGLLQDLEKLVKVSKGAELALLPITTLQKLDRTGVLKNIGMPPLDKIPFNSIKGDYALRPGVMDVKAFDLTGEDISVGTKGTIGLVDDHLNIRVVTRMRPGLIRGTVGQIMSDDTGRLTLSFDVKGTMSNPNVKLDVAESAGNAARHLGGKLLKGLGIGKPSANDGLEPEAPNPSAAGAPEHTLEPALPPSTASEPAIGSDPRKDIEKALKNIFK